MKVTYGRFWGNLGVYHDTHPESLCGDAVNSRFNSEMIESRIKVFGQTDHQVYQVLQDCQIDNMKYPLVFTWKCLVESYLRHDGMQVGQVV